MKKDLIFAPILVLVGAALLLLRWAGMPAHIAASAVGLAVLVLYTALTKKDWRMPTAEIVMRASYGVALITGIVLMNVHGVAALSVIHKASAVLFVALTVFLFTYKVATAKKD